MRIQKVGVVGCGLMGSGIAQVSAGAGFETWICEADSERLAAGAAAISKNLEKQVSRGRLSAEHRQEIEGRIHQSEVLSGLSECDLIVEAVTEDFEVKQVVFQELDRHAGAGTILATNTSSLSVTQLMTVSGRPDRFVGLHFFNPVPVMKLVEVVESLATAPEVTDEVCAFAESLGKVAVRCADRTGFLVNRLLIPYLLDAVRAYEAGSGSKEDIDQAMKLGCGHPMGPFELSDFIGLDTVKHIAEILFEEFREPRMAPPPLLKRLVYAGHLGRKSGQGFYRYH